jgi:hypothetical protein
MENQFRILFRGELAAGADPAVVKNRLQQLTKFDTERIEQLFRQPETVLKSGLDRATAERYLAAIQATGAICAVEPLPPVVAPPATAHPLPLSPPSPPPRETTCPKCGVRQPEGISCAACGIIYAKYDPARNSIPEASLPPPVKQAGTGPVGLGIIVVLVVAIAATLWWLNFPQSGALPVGAIVNQKSHFAYTAPADWLTITPQNYDKVIAEFKGHFPADLRALISNRHPGFVASHLKNTEETDGFSPNFNIIVIDTKGKNFPALTESEKEKATKVISSELSRQLKGYKLLESRLVEVDNITSLQLVGQAELSLIVKPAQPIQSVSRYGFKTFQGYTPEERKNFNLKVIQTMVPGKGRGYIISSTFDAADGSQGDELNRKVIDSFRVLERPPRFGPILMGALNGGLLAAGGYLLWFLFGRLVLKQQGPL